MEQKKRGCALKEEVYKLLAKQFRTAQDVRTEIINLQSILNLPKGTEHFLSDLHGEADTFKHLLRIASGVIQTKIDLAFGTSLTLREKNALVELIYDPPVALQKLKTNAKNVKKEYKQILLRLIDLSKLVTAKYTRSKVRKSLPEEK